MSKVGAPLGNNNATKNLAWRDALIRALKQHQEAGVPRGEALNRIAEGVIRQALKGDTAAIVEIANRLDGKSAQGFNLTQDSELTIIHRCE